MSGFPSTFGPTLVSSHRVVLASSLLPAICCSDRFTSGMLQAWPGPPPRGPRVPRQPMFILPWVVQTSVCRLPASSLLPPPLHSPWGTLSSCSLPVFPNHCHRKIKEEPPTASGHQPDRLSAVLPLSHSAATFFLLYPFKSPLFGTVQPGPGYITFFLAYMSFI